MSTAAVLPGLTDWVKQHVTTLYTATSKDAFTDAFNAFVAKNASITVNGKKISRDQYMQQLLSQKFEEAGAEVNFLATVEVPADPTQTDVAGDVGASFKATIDEKFLVLGVPETRIVTSSLNVVIIRDPTIEPPHLPGKGGLFDPRRVSVLNQVTVVDPNSVLIPLPNPGGPVNPGGPIKPPTSGSSN
ncbi:hypothetical protein BXZ70DRAFT_950206 [Cristinia sonorae]|uniref:Uncharacterized protein n=1 Tax=Cristinia sonorae TaxID=1940300 RepID=A0A8K0UJ94_9AGAR|nr:hypothetical protein BXZ70DRAFT_950206 [Cristinia sonorae]